MGHQELFARIANSQLKSAAGLAGERQGQSIRAVSNWGPFALRVFFGRSEKKFLFVVAYLRRVLGGLGFAEGAASILGRPRTDCISSSSMANPYWVFQ